MEYILWMRGLKYIVLGDCESNLIQTIYIRIIGIISKESIFNEVL